MSEIQKEINIRVKLDEDTFKRFAVFNTFILNKRWRQPAIFAAILLAFAIVCFTMTGKSQSALIGSVLTLVALSMPITYYISFLGSVKAYAKKERLPRAVYELTLTDAHDGIAIRSLGAKRESAEYEWKMVHAAYRRMGCVYLYMLPTKAFLLPDGQADVSADELWSFIAKQVPTGRAHDGIVKA